jgi:hypothetical protein
MSIIRSIPVELSEVVKEANLIVEVKCLEPFMEEVTIKSADPKKPAPPFKKKGFVFSVKNVLKNTENVKIPQTIRVPREEWRRFLSQHKEKYADGPSKSYGVKEYETEVNSMEHADILFLNHFQGMFELEVRGAFESSEALEKITMLIAAK